MRRSNWLGEREIQRETKINIWKRQGEINIKQKKKESETKRETNIKRGSEKDEE